MSKKSKLKRAAVCLLAASMLMSVTGCGSAAEKPTVTLIVKAKNLEFWDTVNKGAADAGEELGCNVELFSTENESQVSEQISMVDDAVKRGVDAIVVAPINKEALTNSIQNAKNNGVMVITIDTQVEIDDVPYIGTNNEAAGAIAGRNARKVLDESKSGKVGIVALTEESPSSAGRVAGFRSELELANAAAMAKYAIDTEAAENEGVEVADPSTVHKIEVVDIKYCGADTAKAQEMTEELIDTYPDIEMIYGVNQNSTIGICQGVENRQKGGQIKVIGFNAPQQEIDYIRLGILNGVVVQNPYNMGYLGIKNALDLINGEIVPDVINTGATFIDMSNIDDADVQLLLNPFEEE